MASQAILSRNIPRLDLFYSKAFIHRSMFTQSNTLWYSSWDQHPFFILGNFFFYAMYHLHWHSVSTSARFCSATSHTRKWYFKGWGPSTRLYRLWEPEKHPHQPPLTSSCPFFYKYKIKTPCKRVRKLESKVSFELKLLVK